MFAVVQIGSSERRSPCITARMVRAREGCARVMAGTLESAVAASEPWTKRRRVVRIETLPDVCWRDLLTEGRPGTSPPSYNHPSLGQLGVRPDRPARFGERIFARIERGRTLAVAVQDLGRERRIGRVEVVGRFHANVFL